jgi:hypothetical protein
VLLNQAAHERQRRLVLPFRLDRLGLANLAEELDECRVISPNATTIPLIEKRFI